MARKTRKYRPQTFTYGIVGRLPGSYCSHICPLTRDTFRTLLRQHVGRRRERWNDEPGTREWNLPFASSKHLHNGYTYSETYLYVVGDGRSRYASR